MTEDEREMLKRADDFWFKVPEGGDASNAEWFAKFRKNVDAGRLGGRVFLGFLGLITLIGGAVAAAKGAGWWPK